MYYTITFIFSQLDFSVTYINSSESSDPYLGPSLQLGAPLLGPPLPGHPLFGPIQTLLFCVILNMSYLTDSYISSTLKLESRQKFCFNSLIRSSTYGKKIISDFPPCGNHFLLIHFTY